MYMYIQYVYVYICVCERERESRVIVRLQKKTQLTLHQQCTLILLRIFSVLLVGGKKTSSSAEAAVKA